jgi:hypothetical protein
MPTRVEPNLPSQNVIIANQSAQIEPNHGSNGSTSQINDVYDDEMDPITDAQSSNGTLKRNNTALSSNSGENSSTPSSNARNKTVSKSTPTRSPKTQRKH